MGAVDKDGDKKKHLDVQLEGHFCFHRTTKVKLTDLGKVRMREKFGKTARLKFTLPY